MSPADPGGQGRGLGGEATPGSQKLEGQGKAGSQEARVKLKVQVICSKAVRQTDSLAGARALLRGIGQG